MFSIETKTKTNNRLKIIELRTNCQLLTSFAWDFCPNQIERRAKFSMPIHPFVWTDFDISTSKLKKLLPITKTQQVKVIFNSLIFFIYMIIAYRINLSLNGLCQGRQSVGTSRFLSCNWNSECILIILYTVHWLPGNVFCQFIKPIASLGLQCTTLNLPEIEIWMFKVIWESNWRSQFFQTVRSLE